MEKPAAAIAGSGRGRFICHGALPTDRVAILSEIGSGPIEAVHAAVCVTATARRQRTSVRIGNEHDPLIATGDASSGGGRFVAHADLETRHGPQSVHRSEE